MNPATGWGVGLGCFILGCISGFLILAATAISINLADTIRMWRNDRRDARDVKRGVL